jgi:2-methylisocitrate lyase-like PEP mutase family enzyme
VPVVSDRDVLVGKAETLRALHVPGSPLVLPNVWDAASARTFAGAGAVALATSSGAVAESLGFEDGETTPPDEMFGAIGRITGSVGVPVSADVERGYRLEPAMVVERLVGVGAVGCNLEDSRPGQDVPVDPAEQAEFLAEVRAAADAIGVPLVINARVDTWVRGSGTPDERLAAGIERARAYRDAGADSVYPILLRDEAHIATFVEQVGAPTNVLHLAGGPSVERLGELGVARITYGTGLHGQAMAAAKAAAERIVAGDDPYAG